MARFSCKCGHEIDFDDYQDFESEEQFIDCSNCGRLLVFNEH